MCSIGFIFKNKNLIKEHSGNRKEPLRIKTVILYKWNGLVYKKYLHCFPETKMRNCLQRIWHITEAQWVAGRQYGALERVWTLKSDRPKFKFCFRSWGYRDCLGDIICLARSVLRVKILKYIQSPLYSLWTIIGLKIMSTSSLVTSTIYHILFAPLVS